MSPLVTAAIGLFLPVAAGFGLGVVGLFRDPDAAIDALNRVALYVGFPLLIIVGLVDRDVALPAGIGFWIPIPAVALGTIGVLWAVTRLVPPLREDLGPLALTAVWGNVAYVGLPVVEAVLGPAWLGVASLAVALHVLISMLMGPLALLVTRGESAADALRDAVIAVARQPLAWAPAIGLALRWLPAEWLAPALPVIKPLAGIAGPLALMLIGLFLHTYRHRLGLRPRVLAYLAAKLILVPALTLAIAWPLREAGWLAEGPFRVLILLSAMPTAISTFALALAFDVGQERVAVAVVTSTVVAIGWLPVVIWWLG